MSPSWKIPAALVLTFAAFASEKERPSLTLDTPGGTSLSASSGASVEAAHAPKAGTCPAAWSLATEIAPSLSFVNFSTVNDPVGAFAARVSAVDLSLTGLGITQSFRYGQSACLRFYGAYSRAVAGAGGGIYSGPSVRGSIYDVTGEFALTLAADDLRRVCFEPFAGYALLDAYMTLQAGPSPEREPWDHIRFYGPIAGLTLRLQPVQSLELGAKLGFVRSHLWDKQQSMTKSKGNNRLYAVVSSMRLDYNVTETLSTHASVDYQGWSAASQRLTNGGEVSAAPYLKRISIGFGARMAY